MPNISFDIFFNEDTVNITASRGKAAPRVKPEWKVRSAPKLPPKTPPQPATAAFANPAKSRDQESAEKATESTESVGPAQSKRAPKKIEVRNKKSSE